MSPLLQQISAVRCLLLPNWCPKVSLNYDQDHLKKKKDLNKHLKKRCLCIQIRGKLKLFFGLPGSTWVFSTLQDFVSGITPY